MGGTLQDLLHLAIGKGAWRTIRAHVYNFLRLECFVLTEGTYKGNCNYNTNASATCTPPCELYGNVVRSVCIRR